MLALLRSTALALLATAAPLLANQDCPSCEGGPPVALCLEHQGTEDELLADLSKRLKSSELELRLEALDQLAALTEWHTNAPSPRVAAALAEQLAAESPELRLRAAELLGKGQHGPTALAALLGQIKSVNARLAKLGKTKLGLDKKLPKDSGKTTLEDIEELLAEVQAAQAKMDEFIRLGTLHGVLVEGLGGLHDDRATRALITTGKLDFSTHSSDLDVDRALLNHGTQAALRAVAGRLKQREKALTNASRELAKQRRARLPKQPKSWQGTRESWKVRAELQRTERLRDFQAEYDQRLQRALELHQELGDFGRARELKDMPAWSDHFATPWKRWISKNAGSLPEELGTLSEG